MLNKKDDIKFLDFDKFLDISKINKKQTDVDDLCNIRYTTEEEQQHNKKVAEALKDACDSSDEEKLNKVKEQNTYIQDIVNFCGENTLGLKNNNFKNDEKNFDNENKLNKTSSDKNGEKYLELKDSYEKELDNNKNNIDINYENNKIDEIQNGDNNLNNLENKEEKKEDENEKSEEQIEESEDDNNDFNEE